MIIRPLNLTRQQRINNPSQTMQLVRMDTLTGQTTTYRENYSVTELQQMEAKEQ